MRIEALRRRAYPKLPYLQLDFPVAAKKDLTPFFRCRVEDFLTRGGHLRKLINPFERTAGVDNSA